MLADFCFLVAVVLAWSKLQSFWVFLKEKVNYVSLCKHFRYSLQLWVALTEYVN